jgi:hypothetical protein
MRLRSGCGDGIATEAHNPGYRAGHCVGRVLPGRAFFFDPAWAARRVASPGGFTATPSEFQWPIAGDPAGDALRRLSPGRRVPENPEHVEPGVHKSQARLRFTGNSAGRPKLLGGVRGPDRVIRHERAYSRDARGSAPTGRRRRSEQEQPAAVCLKFAEWPRLRFYACVLGECRAQGATVRSPGP